MPLFAIQNSSRALNSLHNSPYTPAYSMPQGGYGSLQGYGDAAAAALYGGYGGYGGYGNNGYGTGAYGYGTYGGGYGSMGPMAGAQTLIYPSLNGPQSVLPPALGPTTRSGIEVRDYGLTVLSVKI